MNCLVMKFGGKSLARVKNFLKVADIIIKRRKEYKNIVVVVSAMGNTTNELLKLSKTISQKPSRRELDMLLSVGERISMSLLSMALHEKNIDSISYTGSQSGIITTDEHANASIINVKPNRIIESLKLNKIVIVAGFQGVSENKEITTLKRGGSDTTAVALSSFLNSKEKRYVEFYKDEDGIYSFDPKEKKEIKPIFYNFLSYNQAIKIISENNFSILSQEALKLAKENDVKLKILNFKNLKKNKKTIIS